MEKSKGDGQASVGAACPSRFGAWCIALCAALIAQALGPVLPGAAERLLAPRAHAQDDPFAARIENVKKIDPEHVVRFRVVAQGAKDGAPQRVVLQMDTRAEFKIYEKGLKFALRPEGQPVHVALAYESDPPAKEIMDPWYNEKRAIHLGGTRFTLTAPESISPVATLAVTFEACSAKNCLLPTTFVMPAAVGSVGKVEKRRASGDVGDLLAPESNKPRQNSVQARPSDSFDSFVSQAKDAPSGAGPGQGQGQGPSAVVEAAPANASEKAPSSPTEAAGSPGSPSSAGSPGTVTAWTDSASLWVQESLAARSWWLFPALFLAGLLMNLTPCVYPMIPITLNVLSSFGRAAGSEGAAPRVSRRKVLPIVYVGGMVLSYSAMGVVAGMTGTLFGSLLQNVYITVGLSLVMFLLGLSMLGVFNMTAVQNFGARIPIAERYPVAGVLTMGAVSGLVSAPCTGPVLSMILLLIGQSKDPAYGFILMVFFALGFGAPYVALGLFTQSLGRLPKAHGVLKSVKTVFAALMFALALYYVKPLLGRVEIINVIFERPTGLAILCTALFALVFYFAGKAKDEFKPVGDVGMIVAMTFLALWVTLHTTSGFIVRAAVAAEPASPGGRGGSQARAEAVAWEKDWRIAVQRAQVENKPMMVDAWAEWCAACLKMDAELWALPDVAKALNERFIPVKLDFTRSTPFSEQMIERWDLSGLPAVGFFPVGADFEKPPQVLFREAIDKAKFEETVRTFLP